MNNAFPSPEDERLKILVIDDSPVNIKVITATIKHQLKANENPQLITASNGEEGIQAAYEHDPDLIICDVMMPEISGYDVCERLRQEERFKETYFIFLTAKTQVEDVVQGLMAGADDYISKPFQKEDLVARLRVGFRICRQQKQLKQMASHLASAEMFSSLGAISAAMSHELNSPLGALESSIRTLKKWVTQVSDSHLRVTLEDILDDTSITIEHIERISSSMWKLNRYGRNAGLEQIQIKEELDTALFLLSQRLKFGSVKLITELDPDLPEIRYEEGGLIQVFINLISNALDANGNSGTIKVTALKNPQGLSISVQDEGCGISSEDLPFIFNPMFTTKANQKGTGLGLNICKRIVENNNGKIWAESPDHKGTIFHVEIEV